MALEDLRSAYGPTNKKGKPGTGEVFDTLGFENVEGGLTGAKSKFATPEKRGKLPKGPDFGGNIPPEDLTQLQPK
tara:strand:- start:354 stop:578 length:225 start_codon:yes stop_codon:yes gene_type:complete